MSQQQQYLAALAQVSDLAREPKKHRKQLEKLLVNKTCIQSQPFTCMVLVAEVGGRRFYSEGYARQNPVDAWNPEVGRSIAYNRALNQLVSKLDDAVMQHWFEINV